MKRFLLNFLFLLVLAGVVAGGCVLWWSRPWRSSVLVNGCALTARELDLRAQMLLDDAVRMEHLVVQPGFEREVFRRFRRRAAKMWIMKEVFLSEAIARGVVVTPADEKEAIVQANKQLKSRNLTLERFFKEGPLDEEIKRQEFREGMVIDKFTKEAVYGKIELTAKEIDDRQTELRKKSFEKNGVGKKPFFPTRKAAMDSLRAERYNQYFRKFFRELFVKSEVRCPDYPDLESLDAVSAPRPEDRAEGVSREEKGK